VSSHGGNVAYKVALFAPQVPMSPKQVDLKGMFIWDLSVTRGAVKG
jgi:hypothetical protein